jgi:Tol biopolymer transport system component
MNRRFALRFVSAAVALCAGPALALEVEELWRVSVASDGTQAVAPVGVGVCCTLSDPEISADGRFVGFYSVSNNLVADDTNETVDAFVHDMASGKTIRVSVASDGTQGRNAVFWGTERIAISDTGDVAFTSSAEGLVPDDTNGAADVFVHSLATHVTERVSIATNGAQAASFSNNPAATVGWSSITPDGRFVAYESSFSDLTPNDTNGVTDVFLWDRFTRSTSLLSVDFAGLSLGGRNVRITPDGRYAVFSGPTSPELVLQTDVYLKDRADGELRLESRDDQGPIIGSGYPSISDDGQLIAFTTSSSKYVPNGSKVGLSVLVRDRAQDKTTMIFKEGSVPQISGDGRFVVALAGWCTPAQVTIYDRYTGQSIFVSVTPDGHPGNGESAGEPKISRDGRFVAFRSSASDLVAGDSNGVRDIFVARIGDGFGRGSVRDLTDTDGDGIEDECDGDDDNDGMPDAFEIKYGFNPKDPSDAALDSDGDGLTNLAESKKQTNPRAADTDGDGVGDAIDVCPLVADPNQEDFDKDGMGDACDGDDDNDGEPDFRDAYPLDPTRTKADDPTSGGTTTGKPAEPAPSTSPSPAPEPTPVASSSSPPSGGGGGGATGWLEVLLLAAIVGDQRRRRRG